MTTKHRKPEPGPGHPLTHAELMRISEILPEIARGIDKAFANIGLPGIKWTLMTWTLPRGQYIANGARGDVAKAMRELLARWGESEPDDRPYHLKGN